MKQQRLKFKLLALMLFALFAVLAAYGGYSVTSYGNRWFASSRNPRVRAAKENVTAGDILDRAGTVLATTGEDGERHYQQSAADRSAIAHALGDPQGRVANGVETFQTRYLYGFETSIVELATSALRGENRQGDTVRLTLDAQLCARMAKAFQQESLSAGKNGAAVALNWRTGEVVGMTSLASFDPEHITQEVLDSDDSPFWNRVTQALYPPGSTFKTVVTAAALRSLPGAENLSLPCGDGVRTDSEHMIHDYGGESHGELSLAQAFRVSCNQYYAQLALNRLGDTAMKAAAERFGFNDNFLFRDLVVENSRYPTADRTPYEIAMTGIGQSQVLATPLHMCLAAAAVANDGVMMEPRLLKEVTGPGGTQRLTYTSKEYRKALEPAEAKTLQGYMRSVVTRGTGTRAAVQGLQVCGKTGTAESTLEGRPINYGWFIGFLQEEDLPFALAVVVEDIPDGEGGGSAAAPIARDIFRYLQANRERVTN